MKKVALINQRYGKEVNGGSEYYTKLLAEHLSGEFEIEVLTTTALSYESWDNYYNVGEEQIDGVTVRRFRVDRPRDVQKQRFSGKLMNSFGLKANWLNRMWVEAQDLIPRI